MVVVECSIPGCSFKTNDVSEALAIALLRNHNLVHQQPVSTAPAAPTAAIRDPKPERLKRLKNSNPEVNVNCEPVSTAPAAPTAIQEPKPKRLKGLKNSNPEVNVNCEMEDGVYRSRLAETLMNEKADILKSGSPSIYKLKMREEKEPRNSKLSRQFIGDQKNTILHGGKEKVFLLVGATGAGKSTLINGMMNYILDIKWEDKFRFKVITEDDKISQAKSQTQDITAYTVYPMVGSQLLYTFTVIDTPGFGATEGLQRDKEIPRQIKEFFSLPPPQGIDHIDGIGFVVQSSHARLTHTQRYIFDSILSIFGKDVSDHFFMMITFADGQRPPVLDAINEANMPNQADRFFKFNNSALFAQNVTPAEDEMCFDQMFWKLGMKSYEEFFKHLQKSDSVSLRLTQDVLHERDKLCVLLDRLNQQISIGLNTLEEIRHDEIIIQQRESEITTNKDFTYTVEILKDKYIDLTGKGQHTTTCLVCNNTCHENCTRSDDDDKELCCVMTNGNCTVCPGKCRWTSHRNRPFIIERVQAKETRTSEDLKKKYHVALEGKVSANQMLEAAERDLFKVHDQVVANIRETKRCINRLDEIALRQHPLSEVEHIQLLIESEKNEAKPGWKNRVAYFEEALQQATLLSTVKNEEELQQLVQKLGSRQSRRSWLQRLKFW